MPLPCPVAPRRSLPRGLFTLAVVGGIATFLSAAPLHAARWHVNCETGKDTASGREDAPFATIQKAIKTARDGDVIELHPKGAVFRQSATFSNRSNLTIEGNGVTLDGADPLPADGWEEVEPGLVRRRVPRTALDRHLLIRDGKMERMGRTQSANSPTFPAVADLKPGQFCFENDGEKSGWLYVRGATKNLEWATRVNGIATGGTCRNLVVRNLNTRNFLNDGFNIHGDARELRFETITGYDCFDEGFSAHETSECQIDGGRFYGNENGVADVNSSETIYRNCEFTGNVNFEVLFAGAAHQLIDCRIVNTTAVTALSAGPRAKDAAFDLKLIRVAIDAPNREKPGRARVSGGTLTVEEGTLGNMNFDSTGTRSPEKTADPGRS